MPKKTTTKASRQPSWWRALAPLRLVLICALLYLSGEYHVRHVNTVQYQVQVNMEEKTPTEEPWVDINGLRQTTYGISPIGFRTFVISAPNYEPQVRRRFVWYGGTDLGVVDLVRSRGALAASVEPKPESYELRGTKGSWTNTSGVFTGVPVGKYEVVSRFGSQAVVERTKATVSRNQTNRLDIKASIGSLELSAEPKDGTFVLTHEGTGLRWRGEFPDIYPHLPTGAYRLLAQRAGYERDVRLDVRRNETNRMVIKFVYGAAEISTTPPGATVFVAGKERGKTPITINQLPPGRYKIEARLQGYDVVASTLTVDGETTTKWVESLVNTRFRESMEAARQSLSQHKYSAAIHFLEEAAAAQPGNVDATRLLRGTRASELRKRAEEFVTHGELDAALEALAAALVQMPEDSSIIAVQNRIRKEKADKETQQILTRFRRAVADARSAANKHDYQRAIALLGDAKEVYPDQLETAALETEFRKDQLRWIAESTERKRRDEITARPDQFKEIWERAVIGEGESVISPLFSWKTTKAAAEVRTALERIGTSNPKWKVSEITERSGNIFTAKLGALLPALQTGYYGRIGVVTYGDNNTQILLRICFYEKELVPLSPDSRANFFRTRAEWLRTDLVKQLEAEVK